MINTVVVVFEDTLYKQDWLFLSAAREYDVLTEPASNWLRTAKGKYFYFVTLTDYYNVRA